jgi:enduracididine biosynthesis enzyme MppP
VIGEVGSVEEANLTELELAALESDINVADGHARHEPTPSQQRIIDRLPELFEQAASTPASELDREAQAAFLTSLGQASALRDAQALTCYSSSVAMEVFARALDAAGLRRVALIHPTFDNIADILRGCGLSLSAIQEDALADGRADVLDDAEVLFVTTPNNPTGTVLRQERLTFWGEVCAERGMIIALDTSFRGFDPRAQYDHYSVLVEAGVRYVVIEDTGKLWPTLDLKAGFLIFSDDIGLPLRRIYTDILLGVSPLILQLIKDLAEDASAGGLEELYRFVSGNRAILRNELTRAGMRRFPDADSRISVERVLVPPPGTATDLLHELRADGIHVLPCRQFHWADPTEGERFVRVALGRPPADIGKAAAAIAGRLRGRAP